MQRLLVALTFLWVAINATAKDPLPVLAERNPFVSGYVKDAETGELLIGATVYVKETKTGGTANSYGFFSVTMPKGDYTLVFAFLGYQSQEHRISLFEDKSMTIQLKPDNAQLAEIQVVGDRAEKHVETPQMGVEKLQAKTIKEVPALMGEVDPIKVIQLLPGVQAASEGSSGFSVRGGNPDQNLILLDEAIVYNAGHMMGFFSVFNNDAVKDLKIYKGDIPARSGGRLASLLDIRMKDGNSQKFSGAGGIGTISSRLTLEGPIGNERTTFLAAGRRTYADIFLPLANDEAVRDNKLYFYDLNAKVSHTFSDKDRVFVSGYFGRDVFKNNYSKMDFGNQTVTARWNHVFSPRLFANFTVLRSNYDYSLGTEGSGTDAFLWESKLTDYSVKADFNYYLNEAHNVSFGIQSIYHDIMPGYARGIGEGAMLDTIKMAHSYTFEHALYAEDVYKISPRINFRYGLRYAVFQNMGKATVYEFGENDEVTGEKTYGKGDIYKTYHALEPRLGLTYLLTPTASLKASYSRTAQFLHLASNSTSGTPLDVWFPSSPNVKPQLSDQISAGWFKNLDGNKIELSAELFYKKMQNSIDFKDYPDLLLNEHLEGELRFGKSYAYGAEMLVRFNLDKWNGWVGYTYSRSERKINGINDNEWYLSPYDHPHDCSVVLNHRLSKRVMLSGNWVYFTGSPTTFPVGRFESGGTVVPIYSKRNAERMPDYHRLDLGCTIAGKEKPGRRWQGEWVISLYNAYARHNAWSISFVADEDDPYMTKAQKTYLFSMIPSVTYNFKF
ncbi:MAG: TonB-dependent receptor [Breznakibacter sp.]